VHSTKPVPGCDVGEVAGGQVAVGLVAELLSEAGVLVSEVSRWIGMRVDDGTVSQSLCLLLDFNFDATAYALQEREGGRFGGRLGVVELEGCESGAFVDGVAEDERLSCFSMVSFSTFLLWDPIASSCSSPTTLATNPLSKRAVLLANNVTSSTAGLNLGTPAPLLITLCSLSFGACCMQASSSSASKPSQPSCLARIVKAVVFGELSWLTVPDCATMPATMGSSG
jgi:hypothetical protein